MNIDYMTIQEASELWHIDISTIGKLLRGGQITGATKIGSRWMIPKTTAKPIDRRTKQARLAWRNEESFFRFPLYVNASEKNFIPPLSEEEAELRQAQLDFLACDFEQAMPVFNWLGENAQNIYVKISALLFECLLSTAFNDGKDFDVLFDRFFLSFAEDFPHKEDMEFLISFLYDELMLFNNSANHYHFDKEYEYSPSSYPMISVQTLCHHSQNLSRDFSNCYLEIYEIKVRELEQAGFFLEAQLIHLRMFVSYYLQSNEILMYSHLKKAMDIAYKHNFFYFVADAYSFYPNVFEKALSDFPNEFSKIIIENGKNTNKSFSRFMKSQRSTDLYLSLSREDYPYIFYAILGYSYDEIGKILHKCQRTIASRYLNIFKKLGVQSKHQLLMKINHATGKSEETMENDDQEAIENDEE